MFESIDLLKVEYERGVYREAELFGILDLSSREHYCPLYTSAHNEVYE